MLELRPNCECCDCDLANGSLKARICTFECTFCDDCAEGHFNGLCPNCGGDLVLRPTRPIYKLDKHPPATKRTIGSHPGCQEKRLRPQPVFTSAPRNQKAFGAKLSAALLMLGFLLLATANPAEAAPAPVRKGPPEKPISVSVSPPANARIVYISGTVADPIDANAPTGTVERYGDTETQTRSVLKKIEAALADQDMSLSDIVMMRVFLAAPPGQERMDFAAMMKVYLEHFGTPAQPNKPARSALQVAGLADAGWLVEIEVTAAKGGGK